jgi:hypothetical protein
MTKRGAYAVKLDLTQPHLAGVASKVRAQARILESLPAQIDMYHLSGGDVLCNGKPVASAGSGRVARRLAHYVLFHVALSSRREPLDFLYIRYQGSSPLLLWALGRLRSRNPRMVVVAEIPSWPYHSEAKTIREKLLSWIDLRSRGRLQRHVDRILTFSRQRHILGIPTITTDNGTDLERVPLQDASRTDGAFRLLGLANLSFWHGYDRVIEGIARYYAGGGDADIRFDIIGSGSELARLQDLTRQHRLESRIVFHGPLHGADLDALVARADVGISSIGMHRLDVDTSNLKSREFCARGLPFVIAYPDRDFPVGTPFAYHAPADDSPLEIARLIAFHRHLLGTRPQYRAEMRLHAENHLAWSVKMQPVLAVLRELLASEAPGV